MTNQTGSCAGVYGRPQCVSSTWFAHVTFTDTGEGLLSITSRENRNGTLTGKKWHFLAASRRGTKGVRIYPFLYLSRLPVLSPSLVRRATILATSVSKCFKNFPSFSQFLPPQELPFVCPFTTFRRLPFVLQFLIPTSSFVAFGSIFV